MIKIVLINVVVTKMSESKYKSLFAGYPRLVKYSK